VHALRAFFYGRAYRGAVTVKKLAHWLYEALGYPWITTLEKTTLAPGDLLIVHCEQGAWTADDLNRLRDDLAQRLPEGAQCVVMFGSTRLEVVRVIDPSMRPLNRPIGG
jgi:hypothetical protein